MKAVVAVDSFKGSMTSMQAGNAVKRGILSACPNAEVVVCPVADGGEGTTDALIEGLGGEKISLTVSWKWHPQPGLRWQRKEIRFVHLRVGWEK